MLQELEEFQHATQLTPRGKDLTTIVTEFGKFRYNVLPMGMCCSGDVSQATVYQLLGNIEDVKTYMDDILLVISKGPSIIT
jgi:hypothetical protein